MKRRTFLAVIGASIAAVAVRRLVPGPARLLLEDPAREPVETAAVPPARPIWIGHC